MRLTDLVDLGPGLASICATPDCALEPATPKSEPPSRIRSASLRLERIVTRSDSNKGPWLGPRGVQAPVVLTTIQAFLGNGRRTAGNGIERSVRRKAHGAVPCRRRRLQLPGGASRRWKRTRLRYSDLGTRRPARRIERICMNGKQIECGNPVRRLDEMFAAIGRAKDCQGTGAEKQLG